MGDGKLMLDIEIPANTTASIFVPATTAESIMENGKLLSEQKEIKVKEKDGNYIQLQTGSGIYHFSRQW